MRIYPRPAHRSEIMTSGWCAGGWVGDGSPTSRPKVPRHGPVRRSSRCRRAGCSMQGAPGGQAAMHKVAGEGGQCRVARVARPPMFLAMRHGMLPGSGTISPKPRSAGEARASFYLRTNRVGAQASPAPLRLLINPRPQGRRGFWHAYASASSAAISSVSLA
jgi:hypothetical protein